MTASKQYEVRVYSTNNGRLTELVVRRTFFLPQSASKFARITVDQLNSSNHGIAHEAVISS